MLEKRRQMCEDEPKGTYLSERAELAQSEQIRGLVLKGDRIPPQTFSVIGE